MEDKDEQLWRIAKKRAGFKKHLASYVIINGFLWGIWWITQGHNHDENLFDAWPIWSTLGWGVGLAFSYWDAYHDNRDEDIMREYQKLKDRESR